MSRQTSRDELDSELRLCQPFLHTFPETKTNVCQLRGGNKREEMYVFFDDNMSSRRERVLMKEDDGQKRSSEARKVHNPRDGL